MFLCSTKKRLIFQSTAFLKSTRLYLMFQNYVEEKLVPTWNWMVSIMDSTEAQLRYGSALSSAGDPGHPSHPLHASQHSGRRERMTAREEASLRTLEGRRSDSEPFEISGAALIKCYQLFTFVTLQKLLSLSSNWILGTVTLCSSRPYFVLVTSEVMVLCVCAFDRTAENFWLYNTV